MAKERHQRGWPASQDVAASPALECCCLQSSLRAGLRSPLKVYHNLVLPQGPVLSHLFSFYFLLLAPLPTLPSHPPFASINLFSLCSKPLRFYIVKLFICVG